MYEYNLNFITVETDACRILATKYSNDLNFTLRFLKRKILGIKLYFLLSNSVICIKSVKQLLINMS